MHIPLMIDVSTAVMIGIISALAMLGLYFVVLHFKRQATKTNEDLIDDFLDKTKGIKVIHDLILTKDDKDIRIDYVILHPHGLFIIETQNYSGTDYHHDTIELSTKVIAYGDVKSHFYNPIQQNKHNEKILTTLLKPLGEYHPGCLVVYAEKGQLYVEADEHDVIKPDPIREYMKAHVYQKLSKEEIDKLSEFLANVKNSSLSVKK